MEKQLLKIGHIPAILWGASSDRWFIAVHGDQSNKADQVIAILAEVAGKKGYQTLSFDLPEHGERKEDAQQCDPQTCTAELGRILAYVHETGNARQVSLFGCSMGAYFSMLALHKEPLAQALLLSPVVDMERLIRNMMAWFSVSEERLRQEGQVETPMKTLSWDYYQYVVNHPVQWDQPTALLYGEADALCEYDTVKRFAEHSRADLTVMEQGEHFFHTEEQLAFLRQWLQEQIRE